MSKSDRSIFAGDASTPSRHPPEEDLARYIDALRAKQPGTLPGGLAAHVEDCQHCQEQILDVFFFLRNPLQSPDASLAHKTFPAKRRRRNWLFPIGGIAAAMIVFVLLMTFAISLPRHGARDSLTAPKAALPPRLDIADHPASVPKRDDAQGERAPGGLRPPATVAREGSDRIIKSSAAFAINPNLESMVGSRTRGFIITIYSPPNHVTLAEEILFKWKEFTREPLNLTLVNNRNETIVQNPVSGGVFLLRSPLPSGLYYWKLESASELFYVGKFFINADLRSLKE